jgi:hypothetical protein
LRRREKKLKVRRKIMEDKDKERKGEFQNTQRMKNN